MSFFSHSSEESLGKGPLPVFSAGENQKNPQLPPVELGETPAERDDDVERTLTTREVATSDVLGGGINITEDFREIIVL